MKNSEEPFWHTGFSTVKSRKNQPNKNTGHLINYSTALSTGGAEAVAMGGQTRENKSPRGINGGKKHNSHIIHYNGTRI